MVSRSEVAALVERWVRQLLEARPRTAHGWPHVARVRRLAAQIARAEGVDPWLAEIAALIHDVGRCVPGPGSEHGQRSAELAAPLLAELPLDDREREQVAYAARWHNSGRADDPLLCVLRDADMLDGLGAIGLARAFMSKHMLPFYDPARRLDGPSCRPAEAVADQVRYQIEWLERMNTETGRTLARERAAFMTVFLEQARRELDWARGDARPNEES